MKTFLKSVLITAIACGSGPALAAGSPPFIPHGGRLLIIGQQRDSIDGYLDCIGIVPGGFMSYTSIQTVDGLVGPATHGAGIMDAQYYVNHYPHTVIQLGLYMVGALDKVWEGKYDRNIEKLADWMKRANRPIYLRIGYEFDLPDNHYDPLQYKVAYRYIVDHLRAMGVTNVAYVWHSASLIESKGNFMDWYPGDDYVDWFAVSIFNPMQIATAKKFLSLARRHHKPFMIAESSAAGCVSTRGKREWFKHYFDFINAEDIKVVCYINSYWDIYPLFSSMHWGDAQIQDDPDIMVRWLQQIRNGFLQSSPDLFDKLSSK